MLSFYLSLCCSERRRRMGFMKIQTCSRILVLLFLVIMLCGNGNHANEEAHMNHIDPQLMVFFTLKDLQVGKKMAIYFPKRNPLTSPHLLPKEEADLIPFSHDKLQYLLHFFSVSQNTPKAKAMEDTLRHCETKPIKGETKTCATSLESMIEFVQTMFGFESHFQVVSTKHLIKSHVALQNYTIQQVPKQLGAEKMVACHTMPYPYTIFYCHIQESESKVFKVLLDGENGDKVEAVAVCHMDTSQWSRNHMAFSVLGFEPGSSHVCHFFPVDNLVWVPKSTASTLYY